MTVNQVRNTEGDNVVDLSQRREQRVFTLLALRDHLAAAHAAFEAHGYQGEAMLVLEQVLLLESELRSLAPALYERRWSEWAVRDTELAHTGDKAHPLCVICTLRSAAHLRQAG